LTFLLGKDVAEHASLFRLKVVAPGAKFVEHSAWDKRRRSELEVGMLEFLSRGGTVVFEDADVLETLVFLEILNALGHKLEKLFERGIARIPQLAIVIWTLEQDFVRTDGLHPIVKTIAATVRISFNAIEGRGMDDGARGPLGSLGAREAGDYVELGFRIRAKTARLGGASLFRDIVSRDDPGASDGVFAKFHDAEG
jgi:hypothetical protein